MIFHFSSLFFLFFSFLWERRWKFGSRRFPPSSSSNSSLSAGVVVVALVAVVDLASWIGLRSEKGKRGEGKIKQLEQV